MISCNLPLPPLLNVACTTIEGEDASIFSRLLFWVRPEFPDYLTPLNCLAIEGTNCFLKTPDLLNLVYDMHSNGENAERPYFSICQPLGAAPGTA